MRASIILLIFLVGSLIALTSAARMERRMRTNLAAADTTTYTVQSGDSLSKIAQKYGIDWQFLGGLLVDPGQELGIPTKDSEAKSTDTSDKATNGRRLESTYTVQAGDTLSGIAQKYGTDWQTLAKANSLSNPDLIFEGQNLIIP